MIYQKDLTRQETREAAGYILSEGMRLEALSLKLMDLIVLGKQVFLLEQMPLEQILEDIYNTLLPLMQKRGSTLKIDPISVYVKVEYDLFKTLLLNLVDNAAKAGSTKFWSGRSAGAKRRSSLSRIMAAAFQKVSFLASQRRSIWWINPVHASCMAQGSGFPFPRKSRKCTAQGFPIKAR